jgi:hypothetical protein
MNVDVNFCHLDILRVFLCFFSQQSGGQMTGIAALAAAAAATQKIQGTSQQQQTATTPVSSIKVVTPTIVTPQGVKVTPVSRQIGKL